jgi:predicted nucleotidyltransferase
MPGPVPSSTVAVKDRIVEALCADPRCNVALAGSLARGDTDHWSDVDLEVAYVPSPGREEVQALVDAAVAAAGRVVARFDASHLGHPDLLVRCLAVDEEIVKVDVRLHVGTTPVETAAVPLHDPAGVFRPPTPPADDQAAEVDEAMQRFTGWLWYGYTKARRGELAEAYNTLELMRRLAYVPCLLLARCGHHENLRRIEQRLDDTDLEVLRGTYPPALAEADLVRSLVRLTEAMLALREFVDRLAPGRIADLEAVQRVVVRAEAEG